MKLSLESNQNPTIPYHIRLEIIQLTAEVDKVYVIPVYVHEHSQGKDSYYSDICGFQVEGNTPAELLHRVEELLPNLVNLARFPTYMFIARRSVKIYPVYTINDQVLVTTLGGPTFRHVELAKVREYLTAYLHEIGELGVPGKSEKLHVRGVSQEDLSLLRPLFYLKKRPSLPGEDEFWSPVFASATGHTIYTYAANERREVDLDNGHEILRLRSLVAQALIADKRVKDDLDLRADRLLPEYWEKVKPTLRLLPMKLVYHDIPLDVYQEGRYMIAVEYRPDEARYSFYLGQDFDDLRIRAAHDLIRRGLITNLAVLRSVG
jgi:hypothetical protein